MRLGEDGSGFPRLSQIGEMRSIRRLSQPLIKFAQRKFALQAVPFFAIADFAVKGREQVKGDVCGLEVAGIGVRDVVREGSKG